MLKALGVGLGTPCRQRIEGHWGSPTKLDSQLDSSRPGDGREFNDPIDGGGSRLEWTLRTPNDCRSSTSNCARVLSSSK
jgi:hypothetical protein